MLLRRMVFTGKSRVRFLSEPAYAEPLHRLFPGPDPVGFDENRVKWLLSMAMRLHMTEGQSGYKEQVLSCFVRYYKHHLHASQRPQFLRLLGTEFGRQFVRYGEVKQPMSSSIFLPLSHRTSGLSFLADLRGQLLQIIEGDPKPAAELKALSNHLRTCLAEHVRVELLQLQQLTLDHTPAALLESIKKHEAVHPMNTWEDLKIRLGPNKRVFTFFHPSLPSQPLVFLHVALMKEVPGAISQILERSGAVDAHAAGPRVGVFYSISLACKGLMGIDLGNFLIKQVAGKIMSDFPCIQRLVTLSPLPNFKSWLLAKLNPPAGWDPGSSLLHPQEAHDVMKYAPGSQSGNEALLHVLKRDGNLEGVIKPILMRLAIQYLIVERRRNLALDPVAHFHMKNGAWLVGINWRADVSKRRMSESCGMMVNYEYKLADVTNNSSSYLTNYRMAVKPNIYEALNLDAIDVKRLFIVCEV